MRTYVALLRGVNVGGRNKLPMAALRTLLESLGHTDVCTYIQSGNAVFKSKGAATERSLESAIEGEFGLAITVVIRTRAQLEKIMNTNPFKDADTSKLHVGFLARKPAAAALAKVDAGRFAPEEFTIKGSELYLHLPNGMGQAKLPAYLDRQLKVPITVRNWATVTKLCELAQA